MHAGHRRERIDVIPAHPDTRRVVMPHRVQEAVFPREQARRHARVEGEGQKGKQVREGQRAADGRECRMRWGDVIVPGDKATGTVSLGSCPFQSAMRTQRCPGCESMHKHG